MVVSDLGSVVVTSNPFVSQPAPENFKMNLLTAGPVRRRPGSYSHGYADLGGGVDAKFDIAGPVDVLNEFMHDARGLARQVAAYDRWGLLAWKGWINALTLKQGDRTITYTLDITTNRLWVVYTKAGQEDREIATPKNNARSRNRFGLLESTYDYPTEVTDGAIPPLPAEMRIQYLGWPARQKEISISSRPLRGRGGQPAVLTVSAAGASWWMGRQIWRVRDVGSGGIKAEYGTKAGASGFVQTIVAAKGEFITSSRIATNAQTVERKREGWPTAWGVLVEVAGESDAGGNRYHVGTNGDEFYYEAQVTPSQANLAYIQEVDGRVRTPSGVWISPIHMRANKWIRVLGNHAIPGMIPAYLADDDQVSYISAITYKEAGNAYSFRSSHDSLEGRMVRSKIGGKGDHNARFWQKDA